MRWIWSILIGLLIWIVVAFIVVASMNWAAARPGSFETSLITRMKHWRIGGKDVKNPLQDTADVLKTGTEHFHHHCQICHGLDGQNTGVPFAERTSPPVANLASARVQKYTDGQLKWIIDNGIRFSGMPGWKGDLTDNEAWAIVRYMRHLPPKGSAGTPKIFQEEQEEHEHGSGDHEPASEQPHQ